jgi:tetratricopeptide (TPR) repeat protein
VGDATDDTVPGESARDDTLVAPSDVSATSAPRIRASRPSLPPATPDYAQLTVVDPAHYVIGREFARGGMGRIQIARDRRLGRDVAVKEVLVAEGSVARRFEREARITARLQHPSIISVHEAGTWPSGEPFYAMRLVTGKTFDEAIAAARTYAERLALLPHVLAVADAMGYAHGQKVIHRDLKPRNVVVGEFGETVVLDWGLAKELGAAEDPASSLSIPPAHAASAGASSSGGETTLGEVIGTPAYMPPEQAEGKPVDERADVYAIGSILYHVLAGRPPFVAESNAALIAALHAAPPLPVSHHAPEVPMELTAIVERAMARDRDVRYPTARALAEDLRRFQNGQLVGAHRYSLRQLLRRWVRRHRTALAATGAALLVAIAIGVVAVRRIVAAEASAQAERALAVANRADTEALMGFMLGDLSDKLGEVGRLDLMEAVARRATGYYDAHRASATDDDAFLAGIAEVALGRVMESRGDLEGGLAGYTAGRARFAQLAARHPDDEKYRERQLEAALHGADVRGLRGDHAGATAEFRALTPGVEQNLAAHPDAPDAIHAAYLVHSRIASELVLRGELDAALAEARTALARATRGAQLDDRPAARKTLLSAHARVGHVLEKLGRDASSVLAEYRIGLALGEREVARDPKNPHWLRDVAISHAEISLVLFDRHDLPGALAESRAALDAIDRALVIEPANADTLASRAIEEERLGMVLLAQHAYPAALAAFAAADAIYLDLISRDPTNLDHLRGRTVIANKLGDLKLATKDARGALASYQVALAIREQLVVRDPGNASWRRDLFYSHYKLAHAFLAVPDATAALAELRAALAVAVETLAAHPKNETYADDVAETHDEIGDLLARTDGAAAQAEYRLASELGHRFADTPGVAKDWAKLVRGFDAKLRPR